MRFSSSAWASFPLIILLASCGQAPQPAVARLALLPIESLAAAPERIADAQALTVLLRLHLTGLKDVLPLRSGDTSEAVRQRATRAFHGYLFEETTGLVLRMHERSFDGKTLRVIENRGGSLAALASNVARQISPKARTLPDISNEAVAAFGAGLTTDNRAAAVDSLRKGVELAPNFGEAWFSLGSALIAAGRGQEALQVIRTALAPGRHFDAIARAQISYLGSSVTQSPDLPEAALVLANLLPADSDWQSRAGAISTRRRQYGKAEQWYRAGIKADPEAGGLWNDLAYVQMLGGNVDAALTSLDAYTRLEPKSANPLDSRGELLFFAGRFAEAAVAFEDAFAKDPRFIEGHTLRKAAEARLLAGDRAGASADMEKLFKSIDSTAREVTRAQWDYRSGRIEEALRRLTPAAQNDPVAKAQLAVWLVKSGKRAEAFQMAPSIPGRLATLISFVSQPSASASVWQERAATAFSHPQARAFGRLATTYALLLDGHDREAAGMLKDLVAEASPIGSRQLLGMYRQALLKSGRKEVAQKEASEPVLPSAGADALFDFLTWDR